MMIKKTKKLPLGIENFKEMRTQQFYYIDKTGLIRNLLENIGKVNLFTRPRRFGKTLNMSMLKYFFETGSDAALFDGLEISEEQELCEEYMGKFPVISVSLKDVSGNSFSEAVEMLRGVIGKEALRFQFLMQSDILSEAERRQYGALINVDNHGNYTMSDSSLSDSLLILSDLLQKHYEKNVVLLIDEYDVPLDKAYRNGYYDEMVEFIKKMFGKALKTNDSLQFAVLTGCLRISKESIFTGLNNFKVYTVNDVLYNEYFGFTDKEIQELLSYYGFTENYDAVREWYDGYQFGSLHIYCPWDVVNYCADLRSGNTKKPQNYWVNTSGNDIIKRFVDKAKAATRNEIELLISGGSIKKRIHQELTYRDLDSRIDNLWSLLYTTGYLTQCGEDENGMTELVIPNREIRWIFTEQINEWFHEEVEKDSRKLESFCGAFEENNVSAIEEGFTAYLQRTICIRDTNTKKNMKENFYHGILLGLFVYMDDWLVMSNAESGEGYSDIAIEVESKEIGIVIELKYAEDVDFDAGCRKAMQQIKDRNYEEVLVKDGMKTIYRYGIACYKKRCKVISE